MKYFKILMAGNLIGVCPLSGGGRSNICPTREFALIEEIYVP